MACCIPLLDTTGSVLASGSSSSSCIVVSGKWALCFDRHEVQPPYTECEVMIDYLLARGVPESALLRENRSKDTIANLYHLKHLLAPRNAHRLVLVVARFRQPRLKYLVHKVFGPAYHVDFSTVSARRSEVYPHEADTFRRTKQFLRHMEPGDDGFLTHQFYRAKFYTTPYVSATKLGVQPHSHHL